MAICLTVHVAHAQQEEPRDSLKVYHDIERAAKKRPITYFFYKVIFNLPKPQQKQKQLSKAVNFDKYKGRIIRNIYVTTYDPLGYSIYDTSKHPISLLEKAGDRLHQKSLPFTVRNQILLRRGDRYDPLKQKESERILRQSAYVHDVSFDVKAVHGTRDSVDVYIREQDVWSKAIGAAWSPHNFNVDLTEINFLGTSNQIHETIRHDNTMGWSHHGNYTVPYIRNTFITANAYYSLDAVNAQRGITVFRAFYSPLAKWMGGFNIAAADALHPFTRDSFPSVVRRVHSNVYDAWAGYSFPLNRGETDEERSTRVIVTTRYVTTRFNRKPNDLPDSAWTFNSSAYQFAGIGLSNRTYYRDYYIYRFGVPEDVPAGRKLNFVLGLEHKLTGVRWYWGLSGGVGEHLSSLGYASLHADFGTFMRNGVGEQGVLNVDLGYFTNLMKLGNWRVRQFARLRTVNGYERMPDDRLYITGDAGLRGFNSMEVYGTRKAVINLQTQLYAPYELLGFRFAPIIFLGFAWTGDGSVPLLKTTMFQAYGIGILLRNDYLVFRTFQFTVGLYPYIPGYTDPRIKFNPIKSYNFTFHDFDIDKPDLVPFQ